MAIRGINGLWESRRVADQTIAAAAKTWPGGSESPDDMLRGATLRSGPAAGGLRCRILPLYLAPCAVILILASAASAQTTPAQSPAVTQPSTAAQSGAVETPPPSVASGMATPAPAMPQAAPAAPAISEAATSSLPRDLSLAAMFQNADVVVKAVMIGLFVASVITWTFLLGKGISVLVARRSVARALAATDTEASLAALQLRLRAWPQDAIERLMAEATAAELQVSQGQDPAGIKERVASRLDRLNAGMGRRMARGTGVLATIGSTAPFVGLFGTVWGIMNSFIGISRAQTTNLAVVAPGIAEALLATAIGLIAAIPAVVIYNMFARAISEYRALLTDLAQAILRLVSRDLDRHGSFHSAAAE